MSRRGVHRVFGKRRGPRAIVRAALVAVAWLATLGPAAPPTHAGEQRFLPQDHGFDSGFPRLYATASGRIWTMGSEGRVVSFDGITWRPLEFPPAVMIDDGAGSLWSMDRTGPYTALIQVDARSGRSSVLWVRAELDSRPFAMAYSAVDTAFVGFISFGPLSDFVWQPQPFAVFRGLDDPLVSSGRVSLPGGADDGALYQLPAGEMWVNTSVGWFRRGRAPGAERAEWESMSWPFTAPPSPAWTPGHYWGWDASSLVEWSPDSGVVATHPFGGDLSVGPIRNMLVDGTGHAWAIGARGIAVRNRGGWLSLPVSTVRPEAELLAAVIDSSGNLWSYQSGAEGLVLVRFDGVYSHRLPAAPTFQTADGVLLAADRDSLVLVRGGAVERLAGGDSLSGPILEDADGFTWFRTRTGLLRYSATTGPVPIAGSPEPSFAAARVIATGPSDGVWLWSSERLFRHRAGAWSSFALPQATNFMVPEPGHGIFALFPDSGLQRFDFARETWEYLGPIPEEVAKDLDMNISDVHVDSDGKPWIVFGGCCPLRFDGAGWTSIAPGITAFLELFEDGDRRLHAFNQGYKSTDTVIYELVAGQWRPHRFGSVFAPQPLLEHGPFLDSRGNPWLFGNLTGFGRVAVFRAGGEWRQAAFEFPEGSGSPVFLDADDQLWFSSGEVLRLDRTAPITNILNPPPARLATETLSLVCVPMLEPGTGIEYQTRNDDQPWGTTWSSSGTQPFTLADGLHCVEIRARDRFGNIEPTPRLSCFEIDTSPPLGSLSGTPSLIPPGDTLAIVGTAADAHFRSYTVRITPVVCGRVDTTLARTSPVRTVAVENDTLAVFGGFDSGQWPDGRYAVELTVVDDLGLKGLTSFELVLDRVPPLAAETSPAFRTREAGGVIHAEGGSAVLVIPPLALETDSSVEVALGTLESFDRPAPPSGTILGDAIRLGFGEAPALSRPAILSFRVGSTCADPLAGTAAGTTGAAVHRAEADGSWVRIGGTLRAAGDWFDVPVDRSGIHALFADEAAPPGEQLALGQSLQLTPRVFRAGGTPGASGLVVSFNLESAGAVTAFVHDRAGRRVRTLAEGASFGAGIQSLRWDGLDAGGDAVTHGLYIVTVRTPAATLTKTCVVEGR